MSKQLSDIMRPSTLDELIGNNHIKSVLRTQFAGNNISHTFIITGKYGSGKTTIARIIANKLDAQVIEHDAGAKSDIETIRDIVGSMYTTSIFSDRKAYIFDEVHKLSKDAQNVLLKVSEEPPEGVYILLCTSEADKLIPALASRGVKLEVKPVDLDGIREAVKRVTEKFKLVVEDRKDWFKLVDKSEGSLRVVYNTLQRLLDAGERKENGSIFLSTAAFDEQLREAEEIDEESSLVKAVIAKDIVSIIKSVDLERKRGAKSYETALGLYRYIRRFPQNKKGILTDLAYILATGQANTWEGLEWALFKNT